MSEEKSCFKRILWKPIENCTREKIKSHANGSGIKSTVVEMTLDDTDINLSLNCYLNGEDEHSESNLSVYLSVQSEEYVDFVVKFKVGILGKTPEEDFSSAVIEKTAADFGNLETSASNDTEHHDHVFVWGENVMSHEQLFKNEKQFIVDGVMTMFCEVNFMLSRYKLSSNSLLHMATSGIRRIFNDTKFVDLEIKCSDGEILKAHKAILAARSDMFAEALTSSEQEQKSTFEVSDFDSTVMKEVLRFIYCGEIENPERISHRLIFAAEKYQLEDLKQMCIDNIVSGLTPKNVIRAFKLADRIINADKLFDECLEIAISNYSVVKKQDQWKELPKDIMVQILDGVMNRFISSNTVYVKTD